MNAKLSPMPLIAVILIPVVFISIGLNTISEEGYAELNQVGSTTGFVFAGVVLGLVYFFWHEMSITDSNRSYIQMNPLTDILAFIGSAFITIRSIQLDEPIMAAIGTAIYTIHVMQVLFKNGIKIQG